MLATPSYTLEQLQRIRFQIHRRKALVHSHIASGLLSERRLARAKKEWVELCGVLDVTDRLIYEAKTPPPPKPPDFTNLYDNLF